MESSFVCQACDRQAQFFCLGCKKHYCEECSVIVHKKMTKRKHIIEVIKKDATMGSPVESDCEATLNNEEHACKQLEFFCLDDNEIFCHSCFEQKHKGHGVIRLEEALKNFSIDKYIKAFGETFKMTEGLFKHIDNELNHLQDNVTQVRSVISSSFNKLREAIDEEETALVSQLEAETLCAEHRLTLVLQRINEQIENCQPLVDKYVFNKDDDAGLDSSTEPSNDNEDKESNLSSSEISEMLATVQEMERSIEKMRSLQLIPLVRLNIKYDENKRKIDFEYLAFSGLQIPREITFNEIGCSSMNVSWHVPNYNTAKKINVQYRLEMSAEAPNRKSDFKVVYEGPECSCRMENLVRGWIYTFRVCSTHDGCRSEWSVEKRARTLNIKLDSSFLSQENYMYPVHLSEWCKTKHFELLYRASCNGMTAADFHKKCDDQGPTITIVKSVNGCIFGGFASTSWGKDGKGHKAPGSFLFTLKNLQGIPPTRFPLKDRMDNNAVFHYDKCGAAFGKGSDFIMYSPFDANSKSHTDFVTYQDLSGKGFAVLSGERNFVAREVEVFKVIYPQRR